jgi:hypothetical protein
VLVDAAQKELTPQTGAIVTIDAALAARRLGRGARSRSARHGEAPFAAERQKSLTPQTAEYAREQSIIDFA